MPESKIIEKGDVEEKLPEVIKELSKYEVEKKIGKGQFSTVYRAKNTENGKIVALKAMQVDNFQIFL
jgi:NIMA (never in mitosis gene a)-related kinase